MWLNEEALDVLVNYYYPRAKWLQINVNWGELDYLGSEAKANVKDDLMQWIDIYDCYTRNAAGFSNVLQDLKFGSKTPKWRWQKKLRREITTKNDSINWKFNEWLYTFMCHRITGSGASFEDDHGYRNSVIQYWSKCRDLQDMKEDLLENKAKKVPMFTSIGNQPPAPKKGTTNVDFMINELPTLIDEFGDWLVKQKRGHKEIVDFLNQHNAKMGHRKFNFQYAAFSMDCSDYYPEYCDVDSHTYLGNNAIRCMQMMCKGYKADDFMDMLSERTGGRAKDLEDVMCDFVRFGQNYVPRGNGTFDHIPEDITNNSGWVSGWKQRQGDQPITLDDREWYSVN